MFTAKKNKNDVAASTQRFLDLRRDAASRYKHFHFVYDSAAESADKKVFVEQYSFECFHLFHDLLCQVEHGMSSGPRNLPELQSALDLLEILLKNLPEIVAQRWQFNAIFSALKKIFHPSNTFGLRRRAVKIFIVWYQILSVGARGADDLDTFFSSLVPNLPRGDGGRTSDADFAELVDKVDSFSTLNFAARKCAPLAPPVVADKGAAGAVAPGALSKGLLTQAYMETLLEAISTESTKIEWKVNKNDRSKQCLRFLLDKIKRYYHPVGPSGALIEPIDIGAPKIPADANNRHGNALINSSPPEEDPCTMCTQCLARWAAFYSFSHRKVNDSLTRGGEPSFGASKFPPQSPRNSAESAKLPPNFELIREIFFGSKTTTNFVLTILREGFLLPLAYAGTMGRVFKVLREWLTAADDDEDDWLPEIFKDSASSGAAGAQKSLQTFAAILASFFVNNPYLSEEKDRVGLVLQISTRILTLFKYLANGTAAVGGRCKLTSESWAFVLKILLKIVRICLPRTTPVGGDYPLATRLAPQLYQTLLVTWVFAGLNVVLPTEMWDDLLTAMAERNSWQSLINEWSKVLESVTKALGTQLYNVDLSDLPLQRMRRNEKIRGKLAANENSEQPLSAASKDLSASYNFINASPSASSNGPARPNRKTTPEMKHVTPPSNRQHQPLSRSHKSVELIDTALVVTDNNNHNHQQLSSPSLAQTGGSEVSSLDGGSSLDGTSNNIPPGTGDYINDNGGIDVQLDGDILASVPTLVEEDCDSVGDEFVMPDDGSSQNCGASDSPSTLQFHEDGSVLSAPETIAVMWRRMLSCLGDINQIQDADIHLKCLDVLKNIIDMLLTICENQGVPLDGVSQIVYRPALVPPYAIFVPWLLKVLDLSERYHKSKLLAINLLCRLIVRRQDIPLDENVKCKFALTLHSILSSGDEELILALFQSCGAKIFYMPFPESSAEFLLLDYIHAASLLLNSKLTSNNRQILIHFASCIINLPAVLDVKSYYSIAADATDNVTPCDMQKQIVKFLTETALASPSPLLTTQALKGMAVFVFNFFIQNNTDQAMSDDTVIECINILLASLSSGSLNTDVAFCVSQSILCFLDILPSCGELSRQFCMKIIESINEALSIYLRNTLSKSSGVQSLQQNNLITRLLLDLIEWCLHLPRQNANSHQNSMCIDMSLQTLILILHNKNMPTNCRQIAQSSVSLLLHFYNQQSMHPCSINEWDKDNSSTSGCNSYLFLKYRQHCSLSVQADACTLKLVNRQTSGKDFIEGKRLKNLIIRSCVDINQWLMSLIDEKSPENHPTKKRSNASNKIKYFPDNKPTLPTLGDADSTSLDRVLAFLEKTSPECFSSFSTNNGTGGSDGGRIEQVAAAIDQLHLNSRLHRENEFLLESDLAVALTTSLELLGDCHIFLDSNLTPTWEKRSSFSLLEKSERLQRELKHVDTVLTREVHKIAVIYVGEGQEDKQSILKNNSGSKAFESFVAAVGYEVDLKQHYGYSGGLPSDGTTSYWATATMEVAFHISTRSMGDSNDWMKKLRHIGNDEVHIVWSEHWRDYRRNIIPTDFCDVLIVIYPLADHLFRIQIEKNVDIPDFGPLFDGALVDWQSLPSLVRSTAINASRAKRLSLEGYKNFLEHRYESVTNTVDHLTVPTSYSNLLKALWMVETDKK